MPAKTVTITARIPAKLAHRLEAYAKAAKRTRSWVVQDILDRYVDGELAFVEAVQIGLRELEAGLGVPHEEAMRQVREFIAMKKRERRKAA
jgi:predicted transcriptional regulator